MVSFKGVQYVLCMMHKCIIVKVGKAKKRKQMKMGKKFINFAEVGGICNMLHWLREEWMSLVSLCKARIRYKFTITKEDQFRKLSLKQQP